MKFTFQYGEIKSLIEGVVISNTDKFTFQYGEIKSSSDISSIAIST